MSGAAASVDGHVVIVTAAGAFTAAGERLTGPVDGVDKLGKLMQWAHHRGGLQPIRGAGEAPDAEPARVWVVGGGCGLLTGSSSDADLVERIGHALAPPGRPRLGIARRAGVGTGAGARPRSAPLCRRGAGGAATLVGRRRR